MKNIDCDIQFSFLSTPLRFYGKWDTIYPMTYYAYPIRTKIVDYGVGYFTIRDYNDTMISLSFNENLSTGGLIRNTEWLMILKKLYIQERNPGFIKATIGEFHLVYNISMKYPFYIDYESAIKDSFTLESLKPHTLIEE